MAKDIFKDRERSEEERFIREQDAKLIEKMREKARLDEIVQALAESLQVSDPELLQRVRALGITLETGPAFLLAPLVQVAWAEGEVTDREREAVLRLAASRGVQAGSASHAQLVEWLRNRPADSLFATAIEAIGAGLSRLPPAEREERVALIVAACREISDASGGGLPRVLGLATGTSGEEKSVLET
ncbi:MAG TPA: hypothetical protein VIB08_03320, partial [Thermoanaerobaculia bacterium]